MPLDITTALVNRIKAAADSVGSFTAQAIGTPGTTAETPLGTKDAGQAWTPESVILIQLTEIGEVLTIIADKTNELVDAVNTLGATPPLVKLDQESFEP